MFGESFHFVDWNKNAAKLAETLPEICFSGQSCKLGSPCFWMHQVTVTMTELYKK